MPAIAADRIKTEARWVPELWRRIGVIASEMGISKNAVANLLIREALDARDEKKRAEARVTR
jgi:hypothetical protein